ncbi:MAG: alpha/beta fold hydrolase, partial [Pseudomonadota bacterium]
MTIIEPRRRTGEFDRRGFLAASLAASTLVTSAAAQTPDARHLIAKSVYEFPFGSYADWLAFMDEAPDPAWRAERMRTLVPGATFARYARQETVAASRIVYRSDGLAINGFALSPRRTTAPTPLVLFGHGGVAEWGRITFFDMLEMFRLAERGYTVLASALRGEGGSEGHPNLGAGDRQDMLTLISVAEELGGIDTGRIGYWGFSRGGGLGYRVAAATDRIRAAVLIGASADLVQNPRRAEFHEHVYPGVVDDYEKDADAALTALSAVYWPERLSASTDFLLIHGAADARVPAGHSLAMARHLTRLDRTVELVMPERGSHTLTITRIRVGLRQP